MKAPPLPEDEEFRLEALRSLKLLDTRPDSDFDAVVVLGKELFQVPICLVSLIDNDRQWFKACIGLRVAETPRAISFCGHAILQPDVFVVLDASKDERFHDNPMVVDEPHIRFYAGAPVRLPSGYAMGTVCIISPEPRESFGPEQRALLARLAEFAVNAMALRAFRREMDLGRLAADRFRTAILSAPLPLALADPTGRLEIANEPFQALCIPDWRGASVADALPQLQGNWPPSARGQAGDAAVALPPHGQLLVFPDSQGFMLMVDRRR